MFEPISELAEINPPLRASAPNHSGDLISFIPMSDVSESGQWLTHKTRAFSQVKSGFTPFQEGDVLFAKITPCMENGKGAQAVNLEKGIGYGSTEFHILRAKADNSPRYIFHFSKSSSLRLKAGASMIGSAGQKRVPSEFFRKYRVFAPIPAEQRLIAHILDTLDTQIQKTEALIAKLEKVNEGLLHDLLTRGIDENDQLRPSPEQAPELYKESPLGLIPREWSVLSISEICSHIVDCPHSTPLYRDSGVLVARTSHIKNGEFLQNSASRVSESEYQKRISRLQPKPGDIVFTREAPVGEAFIIPEKMRVCLGQRVMLLRPENKKSTPEYIVSHIYSGRLKEKIQSLTAGTTNPHLNVSEVGGFLIPTPSLEEQKKINTATGSLFNRISEEKKTVNKLIAQKKGLMDDLLTGRIHVTPLLEKAQATTPA